MPQTKLKIFERLKRILRNRILFRLRLFTFEAILYALNNASLFRLALRILNWATSFDGFLDWEIDQLPEPDDKLEGPIDVKERRKKFGARLCRRQLLKICKHQKCALCKHKK